MGQNGSTTSVHIILCTEMVCTEMDTYRTGPTPVRMLHTVGRIAVWLVIPDHLQCLLAHGGSVNNKCFTTSIKKLSMNKSDRLIVYEVCVILASSTQQCYSFIYFSVVFSVRRFLNVQKSLGGHTKNSVTLQQLKAVKCRLAFLCVYEQVIEV